MGWQDILLSTNLCHGNWQGQGHTVRVGTIMYHKNRFNYVSVAVASISPSSTISEIVVLFMDVQ